MEQDKERSKEFDQRKEFHQPGNLEEGDVRPASDSSDLEEKDVREGHGYDAYTSEDPHVSDRRDDKDRVSGDKSGF